MNAYIDAGRGTRDETGGAELGHRRLQEEVEGIEWQDLGGGGVGHSGKHPP